MSHTIPSLFIMLTIVPSLAITTVFCVAPFLKRQSAAFRHFLWLLAIGTSLAVVAIFPTGFELVFPLLPPKTETKEKSIMVSPSSSSDVIPIAEAPVSTTPTTSTSASPPWKVSNIFWLGWLVGLTVMLLKVAIDQLRIQSLLRSCSAAPKSLTFLSDTIQCRLGVKHSPIILVAGPNQIPFCYGLFHPVIVVPESDDLAKQSIYIHHEMAHLVRHDLVWLFVGQLSCAISWFNPLVWRAFENLRMEGEMAADDLVLKYGIGSVDYAKNLVELVETFQINSAGSSVAVAMAQPKSLARRIARILNDSIARHRPGKALLASITLVASTAVFIVLCVRVVEGQTPSPTATANSTLSPAADDNDSSPQDLEEKRIYRLAAEGGQLKPDEVSSLEKKVAATPSDPDDRVHLLGYYANGDDNSPLNYFTFHLVGNFPNEFAWMCYDGGADDYYPYNQEAYECWRPVRTHAPAGTWIRLSSKNGKTVYALYRGTTLRGSGNKLCVDEVALKSLGWDFKSQPEMTWQFVKDEAVPAGPWIPTSDDATTYAKRSIESEKFSEALRRAMIQSEVGQGDDYGLVNKLWSEQPRGVHYCSEIVYALTKDATVDQLNALVAKGAPVAVPRTELTPLMMAIARRNMPAAKWLLDHGEGKDVREFREAISTGNLEIIQAFLDHGIAAKYKTPEIMYYLHSGEDSPAHRAVVDLISKSGALKPAPNGNPQSLLAVCEEKDTYLLKTLMKLGFNPKSAFTEKSGPLSGKTVVDVVQEKAEKDQYFQPILDILLGKDS